MNRIVFCLHNCFMRNMNYTHAVWEGRNGCVNLFTCCEMKQCANTQKINKNLGNI